MKKHVFAYCLSLALLSSVIGCNRTPQFTDAEVAAAAAQAEKLMSEYSEKKSPSDVDKILDFFRIAMSGEEKMNDSAKMPLLGFMHGVFVANPEKVSDWRARKSEFRGTVIAEVLDIAADFDEERLLGRECDPGVLDYCWGAFYATGDIKYPQKVIDVALGPCPNNAVDLTQMAAVWSLHAMAVRFPAVAKSLNDSLRDSPEDVVKRIAERFDEEERERLFDAGVRMRMGLACPLEHRPKPPQPVGHWKGLDNADDWIANVRTNKAIETCGRFRDEQFVPFITGEVIPAGETNEQIRALAAHFATWMFDNGEVSYALSDGEKARELVKAGCDVPFIKWLAAPLMGAEGAKVVNDLIRSAESDRPKMAMGVLAAYSRWKFDPSETNRMYMVGRIFEWADSRGFQDAQARCALYLIGYVVGQKNFGMLAEVLSQSKSLDPWISKMFAAMAAKNAAWKSRGGGWASTVTEEGWQGFRNNTSEAHDLFAEARRLHPDFTDGSFAEAQTHGGDVEWLDSLFSRMTDLRLDEYSLYHAYAFFALYPRWGGSTDKMERFADICYATGRHDTMITAMYAELQMEVAYEKGVSIEEHFADRKRLDRFLEVCDAQTTNANAYTYVRNQAFFERAFVLGRLGRYGEIGDFAAGRVNRKVPSRPVRLAQSIGEDELELCGLTGPNGRQLIDVHKLYRRGKWDESLAAYKKAWSLSGLTADERRYLQVYEKSAIIHAKAGATAEVNASYTDFSEFYAKTAYWKICPPAFLWCRGANNLKACSLQWRVPLPRNHTTCFSLEPQPSKDGSGYVKVEPRFRGDTFCRGLACIVFFDGLQVGIGAVDHDLSARQAKGNLKWMLYSGGRVQVRIAWSEKCVRMWLGDAKDPVVEAEFAGCLRPCDRPMPVRDTFSGWKVKIYELKALAE